MNAYRLEELRLGASERFSVQVTPQRVAALQALCGTAGEASRCACSTDGAAGTAVPPMLLFSLYSTLLGVYLPGETALFHEIRARALAPATVGDVLTVSGEVSDVREATGRIRIAAQIAAQDGTLVSSAVLVAGVWSGA